MPEEVETTDCDYGCGDIESVAGAQLGKLFLQDIGEALDYTIACGWDSGISTKVLDGGFDIAGYGVVVFGWRDAAGLGISTLNLTFWEGELELLEEGVILGFSERGFVGVDFWEVKLCFQPVFSSTPIRQIQWTDTRLSHAIRAHTCALAASSSGRRLGTFCLDSA